MLATSLVSVAGIRAFPDAGNGETAWAMTNDDAVRRPPAAPDPPGEAAHGESVTPLPLAVGEQAAPLPSQPGDPSAPSPPLTGESAIPSPLLLGIDAGGTMVRAVVADANGRVVGSGQSTGANPVSLPLGTVAGHVLAAVRAALAGTDPERVAAGVLGVAGIGRFSRADAAEALRRTWERSGLRCAVQMLPDPVVAFAAGTPQPRGTVLVGGTGTIAARISDGAVTSRIDGNGWLVGDDGSGFWLGRQAVRAVLAELDGRGEPTVLRYAVLATLTGSDRLPAGPAEQRDLLRGAVYDGPPIRLARLAMLVPAAAEAGDQVAQLIVDRAVTLLAETADALLSREAATAPLSGGTADALPSREPADAAGGPGGPLVLAGSLLTAAGPIRREVHRRLSERYGRAPVVAGEGAGGAAWLAVRGLGLQAGPAVHQRLTAASTSVAATDRAALAADGSRSIHAETVAPP
jgi:N-acetylglucosamine kinase-like BadF-type ATPase